MSKGNWRKARSDAAKIYFDAVDCETGELLEPSLTKQAFAQECDINAIMARYVSTGVIEHVNQFGGQYGDFCAVQGYHDALNAVIEAEDMFMTLPAQVRDRFDNDPGKFLDFVGDESNKDAMLDMGLITPDLVAVKQPVESSDSKVEQLST